MLVVPGSGCARLRSTARHATTLDPPPEAEHALDPPLGDATTLDPLPEDGHVLHPPPMSAPTLDPPSGSATRLLARGSRRPPPPRAGSREAAGSGSCRGCELGGCAACSWPHRRPSRTAPWRICGGSRLRERDREIREGGAKCGRTGGQSRASGAGAWRRTGGAERRRWS